MIELLWVGLLGGLLALDATAVGQFMLSRPLVAGTLVGWLVGDPVLGTMLGAVLELYLLVSFPTGGARFPEGATATVVAVAVAAGFEGAGVATLALAGGLVWGQLGGATVTLQRRLNTALVASLGRVGSPGALASRHLTGVGLDFLRGTVVTIAGVLVGRSAMSLVVTRWPLSDASSVGLMLVGGAVSAGILLNDLGGFRRRRYWFVAGLAVGIIGARFL